MDLPFYRSGVHDLLTSPSAMSKRPAQQTPCTKRAKVNQYKDEIINNPLFMFFSESMIAMDNKIASYQKQIDRLVDEKRMLSSRLTGTQQYILEMECRLETLTETVERMIERESFQVRDAIQATLEQQILENGPHHVGAEDLECLLQMCEQDQEEFEQFMDDFFQ